MARELVKSKGAAAKADNESDAATRCDGSMEARFMLVPKRGVCLDVLLNNAGIVIMHHELHDGHETTTTVHTMSTLLLTLRLREQQDGVAHCDGWCVCARDARQVPVQP
ncbi:hypothetical protein X797_002727 [Metarhizium robertsii]|uniref:Uncharacterized protein n=1 Tax=Metarhizium robertsii TaxID=568076 RepID=A0A0A1V5E1_9HYPO|nr:hypothetical protein X797_002727 [Metarhizium robertsii]